MREAHVTLDDSAFDAMGIAGLVARCRRAGLCELDELVCRGDGAVVQVTVESPLDPAALSSLACVDEWERVADLADGHRYVVAFTAPNLPESLVDEMDDLVGTCDPVLDEHATTLSFVGPQDSICGTVREYEAADVSLDLRKLAAYDGRDRPLDELTERQREVIRTAYDMGYYEVPRVVTTGDVAAELDVDPSTVSEHLQRAERNLLRQHL